MFRKKKSNWNRERKEKVAFQEEIAALFFSSGNKESFAWKWMFRLTRGQRNNIYYLILAASFAFLYFLIDFLRGCSLTAQIPGFLFALFILLRFIGFERCQKMKLPYPDGISALFIAGLGKQLEDSEIEDFAHPRPRSGRRDEGQDILIKEQEED